MTIKKIQDDIDKLEKILSNTEVDLEKSAINHLIDMKRQELFKYYLEKHS